MKLVYTQVFDENMIHHAQLGFKKQSLNYFKEHSQLHRLTIDLD